MHFNDDFISAHIENLLSVEVGEIFITQESASQIHEILELEGNTEDEMRAKRNSFVKLMSERFNGTSDYPNFLEFGKYISSVTTVIDHALVNIGVEV